MSAKLTGPQQDLLALARGGWKPLPGGVGCTNATLNALEKRGWVETRVASHIPGLLGFAEWEWRLSPRRPMTTRDRCIMCRHTGSFLSLNSGRVECPGCQP